MDEPAELDASPIPLAARQPAPAPKAPVPHPGPPAELDASPVPLAATHPTPAPAKPDPQENSPPELVALPVPLSATHPAATGAGVGAGWPKKSTTSVLAPPQDSSPPVLVASPVPLIDTQLTVPVHPSAPLAFPVRLTASTLAQASAETCTSTACEQGAAAGAAG